MPGLLFHPVSSTVLDRGYDSLAILSSILGWTAFVAWSVSFYFQLVLNYRRKFVGGLSIDFVLLNLFGHSSYAIYNVLFFTNNSVQEQYRRRHDGHSNTVRGNDVAFSVHATLITLATFFQIFYYPRAPGQGLSLFNRIVVAIYTLIIAGNLVGVFVVRTEELLDLLYVLSAFKLYVSIAKYIPQAWENYKRKSTVGWSIENILLDFAGGILSLAQLFLDAARADDWSSIRGNPAKFGLSVLSMLFDVLFMTQHYVLYRDHSDHYLVTKEGAAAEVQAIRRNTPDQLEQQANPTERSALLDPTSS